MKSLMMGACMLALMGMVCNISDDHSEGAGGDLNPGQPADESGGVQPGAGAGEPGDQGESDAEADEADEADEAEDDAD